LHLVESLKEAPPAERVDVFMAHIQKEARAVLGMDASKTLDPYTPLNELGFDSLTAVELSNRFAGASGITLSLTLLFDYPTLHAMSTYLVSEVLKLDIGAPVALRPRTSERDASPGGVEELTATLLESIGQMSEEDVQERVKQLRERS
jgi:acyl carrier protein